MFAVMAVVFIVLMFLHVPIAFSMGLSATAALALRSNVPLILIPQTMLVSIDSFVLLAIPLFIIAGALMEVGGISIRLIALAKVLVGYIRGGLAMVVVVGEIFFSGISGSTSADVSAIGSLMIPAMRQAGYKTEYAISVVAAASAMGILVPPCILMLVVAALTSTSPGALFIAGFVPAFVLAALLLGLIFVQAGPMHLPKEARPTWGQAGRALLDAIIPLGMPILIFGGILGGIFTPTEAAAVAVLYALIVSVFIYRELKWHQVGRALVDSAVTTGMISLLIGVASVFAYIMATEQLPVQVVAKLAEWQVGYWPFLLINVVLFIILGGLLEGLPALLILIPVMLPMSKQLGIDTIHYNILAVAATGIGLFLPPVGVGLYIACAVGKVPVGKVLRPLSPFLAILLLGLVMLIAVPWFSTGVPRAVGLIK
jgi:C4-dicarboxylate transporter, DctM subunit